MNDPDPNTLRQLEQLADRIERIEKRLGLGPVPPTPEPPHPVPAPPKPPAKVEVLSRVVSPEPITARTPDVSKPRPMATAMSLEQLIGGRGFAAIGAIVIVIGVALLGRFAWEQGWFNLLPPAGKVGMGALFGAVLLVIGEILRRRISALASAGPSAAGVGAIYASAYSAHAVYDLTSVSMTFALLAATAALGVAVAVRAGLASVAIVSLLSGFLVPILLVTGDPHPAVLTGYLLLLLISALVLSAWKGPGHEPFHALRSVGWWGTITLGGIWGAAEGADAPVIWLLFVGLVWLAVHAERLAAARQLFPGADDPGAPDTAIGRDLSRPAFSDEPGDWRAGVASLSTTAWTTALSVYLLESGLTIDRWLAPAVIAAVSLVCAFIFAGHLRVLRDVPRSEGERVGASLAVQFGALLILAFALALTGWAQVIAWLSLGLAAIVCGRWMNTRALDLYGVIVLLLATVRLLVLGANATPWPGGSEMLGLYITPWGMRFAITGLAWVAAGVLMLLRNSDRQPVRALMACGLGLTIFASVAMHHQSQPAAIIIAWLILAGACAGLDRLVPRLWLQFSGLLLTGAAGVMWLARIAIDGWADSPAPIALHPGLWLAGAIAGVALGITYFARWPRRAVHLRFVVRAAAPTFAGVLLFIATSLEVARSATVFANDPAVQRSALSIYWGLVAVGLVMFGFARRLPPVRYVGLGLMGVATLKALLIDMIGVPAPWRIASFIALGLLMLGVAVTYARVSALLSRPETEGLPDTEEPPSAQ